jgi:tRNA 2-selenouridine synthase
VIEGESKRVGKAVLPDFLVEAKEKGWTLYLELPVEERVKNILNDYNPAEHKKDCIDSYERIKNRIHTPIAAEIQAHLQNDQFAEAVELLLVNYYDPRYQHATDQYATRTVSIHATDVEEALELVMKELPALAIKTDKYNRAVPE